MSQPPFQQAIPNTFSDSEILYTCMASCLQQQQPDFFDGAYNDNRRPQPLELGIQDSRYLNSDCHARNFEHSPAWAPCVPHDALAFSDNNPQHPGPVNWSNTLSLCTSQDPSFVIAPWHTNPGHSMLPVQVSQHPGPMQLHHEGHERPGREKGGGQGGEGLELNTFRLGDVEGVTHFFQMRFMTAASTGLRKIVQLWVDLLRKENLSFKDCTDYDNPNPRRPKW